MFYQQPPVRNQQIKVNKRNIIKVFGLSKVSIQPDKAEITLGVFTENIQLDEAQKENARIIDQIIRSLKEIGIPNEQIQTKNYAIFPQYDYIEGKQIFRGYKVEHLLLISVMVMERTGLAVDTAVKNGANIVSGISFSTENTAQYEQQALSLAVVDSIKKAEVIAGTLGVQLIRTPIIINEIDRKRGEPVPMQSSLFLKSEATTPIQPGTIDITSQVWAEFEYY